MIVPALHLTAAARGVDVSTVDRMQAFAEEEIIRLTRLVNDDCSKRAQTELELRRLLEQRNAELTAARSEINSLKLKHEKIVARK